MLATYNAVDVILFYDDIPSGEIYLVINTSDNCQENTTRKIKVSSRRFLDVLYGKKERVQVLLKNDETNSYDLVDVPCEKGVYRLDYILLNVFSDLEPVIPPVWTEIKESYLYRMVKVTISAYAILVENSNNYSCEFELQMLTGAKLEDSNVSLKRVSCNGICAEIDSSLFNKCLRGESISNGDFLHLTEDIERGIHIHLGFDSIEFYLTHDKVTIQKVIGSSYGVDEKFSCTLSSERVGMVSIFFSKIMKTEKEKGTLKFLNDYFLT